MLSPFILTPFVLRALEEVFDAPPTRFYTSYKQISVYVGGLYLRVVVEEAKDGLFSGHDLVDQLKRGNNPFLVYPEAREGLLFLYTRPLPFFHTPETLDWRALTLASASKIAVPAYAFEEVAL
jgi:hypothetical protein